MAPAERTVHLKDLPAFKELAARTAKAEAEVQRLTNWQESAMTVMSGLQDVGTELGLPLGESITGTLAAETARQLRTRAEKAEAAIERAQAVHHEHTNTGLVKRCKCLACDMARALDEGDADE